MNQNIDSLASLELPVRSIEDAPAEIRDTLVAVKGKFGFVPNLLGALANVPASVQAYLSAATSFEQSSFSPVEQQLVLIAVSAVNECDYCLAAHSTVAKAMLKADPAAVAAVRAGTTLPDAKQNALVTLTREIVANRGHVSAAALEDFLAHGYTREQAVEILLGVAQKTISNFFTHLSPVEIDPAFRAEAAA